MCSVTPYAMLTTPVLIHAAYSMSIRECFGRQTHDVFLVTQNGCYKTTQFTRKVSIDGTKQCNVGMVCVCKEQGVIRITLEDHVLDTDCQMPGQCTRSVLTSHSIFSFHITPHSLSLRVHAALSSSAKCGKNITKYSNSSCFR